VGTRPVYKWDGVKLGSPINGLRAKEFEPCDCSTSTKTTVMYCLIPSIKDAAGAMRRDAMAQCEQKP
jgi:hypothetical protein